MMAQIDIPSSWEWSAEKIAHDESKRIMVLGASDSGKSTYCRFLSRRLMESGTNIAIIDADIGQKDIGPPTCITSGFPAPSTALDEIVPDSFYFVGTVTPVRHLLPVVVGTKQILDLTRATVSIINTTGLIHGIGRILKGFKIEAVRPDAIVAIQRSSELESLIHTYRNFKFLRIAPSDRARPKTAEQRREARVRSFSKYFKNAVQVSLDIKEVIFQRSILFNGRPIPAPGILYRQKSPEGTLIVSEQSRQFDNDSIVMRPGFERNLLCGTANSTNLGTGLGMIQRIDFKAKSLLLLTPVPREKIKIIQFGDIYISQDGRELSRVKPANL